MFLSVVGVSVAVVRVGIPDVIPVKPENVVVTGLSGIPLTPLAIDDRISATDSRRSADSLVAQYMATTLLVRPLSTAPPLAFSWATRAADDYAESGAKFLVVFTLWHQTKG